MMTCPGTPSQEMSELGFQPGMSGVSASSRLRCSGFGSAAFGWGSLEHWRQKNCGKIPCDRRPPPVAGKIKGQGKGSVLLPHNAVQAFQGAG